MRKPLPFLLLVSIALFCTLLGLTFAKNSNDMKKKNDQTQGSPTASDIESLSPIAADEPVEEAATEQLPPPSETGSDSVSPGQSASNESHTSINISSNNGSAVSGMYSLKISDNGCMVEANGPSGTLLTIDAKNGKKGGQQTYTLAEHFLAYRQAECYPE